MPLRSQLAIAFLLLAVVPLSGVTLYTYYGSERAIVRAIQADADALAVRMKTRVQLFADTLEGRLAAMRRRPSAFEKARREALAKAEADALREQLRMIVTNTDRGQGAIPFAIDAEGRLYAPEPGDEEVLARLGLGRERKRPDSGDWVIAESRNPEAGVVIGVARPVTDSVRELRRTAAWNLALGLSLALVAALGILPLSHRMTRHLASLTEAAERLARGERDVRVPVPHGREFKRLAGTFNRMAHELRLHEERGLEQARLRKELEIGRRIQEELQPRAPLAAPFAEASGVSVPAREVGGDFFNYFTLPEEQVAILIGDVSGKGVPAALLMASVQATIQARLTLERDLACLVDALDRAQEQDQPLAPYYTLFLALLDGRSGTLRYVNAGHNTQFLLRRDASVERLSSTGRPPGLYPGGGYENRALQLRDGDALFLFTDGLVEAEDESGEPFGVARLEALLRAHASEPLAALLGRVDGAVREHRGPNEAADDATMVALRSLSAGNRLPQA